MYLMIRYVLLICAGMCLFSCSRSSKVQCVDATSFLLVFDNGLYDPVKLDTSNVTDTHITLEKYEKGSGFKTMVYSDTNLWGGNLSGRKTVFLEYNNSDYTKYDYRILVYPSLKEYIITELNTYSRSVKVANEDRQGYQCYNSVGLRVNGTPYFDEVKGLPGGITIPY